MRLSIFIYLCLGIASISGYTLDKNRACVLTTSNFDSGVQDLQDFSYALVEFYTQKCQHCDDLGSNLFNILKSSEYSKQTKFAHIKKCTVDVGTEKEIADAYQIKDPSTLKLFYKDGSAPVTYEGIGSVAEILNWLKRVSLALDEVKSIHDAQSLINNNQAVAFFFGHVSSEAFNSFLSTASLCGNVTFAHSSRKPLKKKYQITMDPTLVLFEEFGAKKSVETQNFEKQALRYFINNDDSPTHIIHTYDENDRQNINERLILITSDSEEGMNALKALEAGSLDLMSQITLLQVRPGNEYFDELTNFFGISVESLPAVRILNGFFKKEKFALEGEITPENIKTFVKDFKDKKLKPYLRSEPIPQNPFDKNGVRIVVAKNFQEVVFDETKDVLVAYYNSLKPECSDLTPISSSLIQRLQNVNDIVVAKMDIGANEVDRYRPYQFHCSVVVYPKGNKHDPLFYDGERTEDALFEFLINEPSVIPSIDKVYDIIPFPEEFKALILLAGDDEAGIKAQDTLKAASVGLRGKLALYLAKPSDYYFKYQTGLFGIPEDSLPAVRIMQGRYPHKKFALEKEITPENLETFIEDFLNSKLKPYYNSEPIPENPYDKDGIRVVVGKNFEQVILDKNNDVLIAYLTSSNYSHSIFDLPSLSHKLKNATGIVIAKMNASANEIEGLNTYQYKDSLVLYPKNDKQNPLIYNCSFDKYYNKEKEYVMDFLRKHSSADIPKDPVVSTILRFGKEAMAKIFNDDETALVMIIRDDEAGARAEEALQTASADLKGELPLILVKEDDDLVNKLAERCGISMDSIPTVLIVQPPKQKYYYHPKKFVLQSEISPENLKAFVEDFKNDKLQRYYKSASIPENSYDENSVKIVVGTNFHEVVYDENNDVLIAIYDSYHSFCKTDHIFDLPSRLANVTNIVIAKVDIYTNEIDGFTTSNRFGGCRPTLLYSRGAKQSPFTYDPNNHRDVIDFLKENTNLDFPKGQESSTIVPYDETVRSRAVKGFETLILITNDDETGAKAEEALRMVSSDFSGELTFSVAKKDANKSESDLPYSFRSLARDLGVSLDSLPVLRIIKGDGSGYWFRGVRRYAFEGEITPDNLKRFIEDFQNGKLKPYEPIQENSYKNYDEL